MNEEREDREDEEKSSLEQLEDNLFDGMSSGTEESED